MWVERLVGDGFKVHRTTGTTQTILAGVGRPDSFDVKEYEVLDGVSEAYRISSPYKLAGPETLRRKARWFASATA